MKHRMFVILALAALFAQLSARPAAAQGLASIGAATVSLTSLAVEKAGAGCWGCSNILGGAVCSGGYIPGYYNCSSNFTDTCRLTSPGCGAGAMLPLDPDGSSQYVSRGSRLGIPVSTTEAGLAVLRNCEGVVVGRQQTLADIGEVRNRTGTLTL